MLVQANGKSGIYPWLLGSLDVVLAILFWGTLISTVWSAFDYLMFAIRATRERQNSA
jgi:hypothetical protein